MSLNHARFPSCCEHHPIPTPPNANIGADVNIAASATTTNGVLGLQINYLSHNPQRTIGLCKQPMLVAYKCPPRLDRGVGGASDRRSAGESALGALDRRSMAQIGTRKVDKESRLDARDISDSAGGSMVAVKEKNGGQSTSVASVNTSTTPNPEANGHRTGPGTGTGRSTSVSSE